MLLVGGTGLIGRALAPALLERGLIPVAVSRRAPAPGVLPAGTRHVCADRRDLPALLGQTTAAAIVEILAEGPEEVAPLLGHGRRFVAIGSAAVFGGAERGKLYTEADTPSPATPPMRRKLELERLIAAENARGRGATMLRIAYPYGPGHGPLTPLGRDRGFFTAPVVDWVAPDAFAPLQPLWAGDLAQGIAALLCRAERPRPLYHVAGPEIVDWERWLAALGRSEEVTRHGVEDLVRLRPAAAWIAAYLRNAPLLDDRLFRGEVHACNTKLARAVGPWADWCRSGAA